MFDDQRAFSARFEWGEAGLQRLAPGADIVVVVDVLSFATAVDVAVGRGAVVYPCRWRDVRAENLAAEVDGVLAGARSGQQEVPYSLSPRRDLTWPRFWPPAPPARSSVNEGSPRMWTWLHSLISASPSHVFTMAPFATGVPATV